MRDSGSDNWPRLLPGTQLIGQAAGFGLRDAPYLVKRRDGQVVQLSRPLFVLAGSMIGDDLGLMAERAGVALNRRITPAQVAYAAETNLVPLGLVARRDGTVATLHTATALLALRFRIGVVRETTVNALARLLRPLFVPPLLVGTLLGLVACDVWFGLTGGLSAGLRTAIAQPVLALALFGLTVLSLLFHELGHAAACGYGGACPGRIGVGIYRIWPVFFTDVTDSQRLPQRGRLRTHLGGVYFNGLVALCAGATYLASGYHPLLIVVATQQILIIDQFTPWARRDGYHIVSELIGVPDLFTRIAPVTANLLAGRPPDRRVTELKPYARVTVAAWVVTTVLAVIGITLLVLTNAPGYLAQYWQTLVAQWHVIRAGMRSGGVADVLGGMLGVLMVLLPVVGSTLLYLFACRGTGRFLALHQHRAGRAAGAVAGTAADAGGGAESA